MATAAEYLWPLPDSKTLTGGFADSRMDHFHGGVDLRARSPLKIVAPTDGWVERIAVNPAGYGRTLYFRLSDGKTAVFGHLSRYEPELQKLLRDKQLESKTYRVDFTFSDSTVAPHFKAGQTLCFTGSSGRGPAHLHYEVRNGAVQLDPLSFYKPLDFDKPVIAGVSWINLSSEIPSTAGKDLSLSPSPRIKSDEPIAFLIRTYDPGPWGRNSVPHVVRVFQDERLIFEDRCAEIDLLGPANIYEKLVYSEFKQNDRDVRRLFEWPVMPIEIDDELPTGWIEDYIGVIRIEVEDRNGNTTSVRIAVEAGFARKSVRSMKSCEAPDFVLTGDAVSLSWADVWPIGNECRINNDNFAFPAKQVLTAGESFEIGKYFYKRSVNNALSPLWRIPSEDSTKMSCFVLRGGTYGIAIDDSPPVLTLSGKSGKLSFQLTDPESAIDDSRVYCKVDGVIAIPEYEYEENGGAVWTQTTLTHGQHRIEFEAFNRAGLSKTWNTTVTIP